MQGVGWFEKLNIFKNLAIKDWPSHSGRAFQCPSCRCWDRTQRWTDLVESFLTFPWAWTALMLHRTHRAQPRHGPQPGSCWIPHLPTLVPGPVRGTVSFSVPSAIWGPLSGCKQDMGQEWSVCYISGFYHISGSGVRGSETPIKASWLRQKWSISCSVLWPTATADQGPLLPSSPQLHPTPGLQHVETQHPLPRVWAPGLAMARMSPLHTCSSLAAPSYSTP